MSYQVKHLALDSLSLPSSGTGVNKCCILITKDSIKLSVSKSEPILIKVCKVFGVLFLTDKNIAVIESLAEILVFKEIKDKRIDGDQFLPILTYRFEGA